ncbi:MAG: hypothetical protein ABIF19_03460 [Planctomycetota bacterium]
MKVICSVLAAAIMTCVIAGCGSSISAKASMDRQRTYGRLAIICAPKPDANPVYAPMILKEAQSMISHLKFLEKVECLSDVSVDTALTPPVVDLNDVNGYDAVVCLVYSYDSGRVYLDFHMTDTATGAEIWHHQFETPDPESKRRLRADGLSAPAVIKTRFYGL